MIFLCQLSGEPTVFLIKTSEVWLGDIVHKPISLYKIRHQVLSRIMVRTMNKRLRKWHQVKIIKFYKYLIDNKNFICLLSGEIKRLYVMSFIIFIPINMRWFAVRLSRMEMTSDGENLP